MTAGRRDQLATALRGRIFDWRDRDEIADALLPVVDRLIRQAQAEALESAFREDRTTVAKLSPVERLTCYLVKSEDLVVRAAALRQADR